MAKYLYNGVLLPEIPTEMMTKYPYAVIYKDVPNDRYILLNCSDIVFYKTYSNGTKRLTPSSTYTSVCFNIVTDSNEWKLNWSSTAGLDLDETTELLWSNYDIPNGSATATEIYFYGSEPVDPNAPEEPTEEVYYKISGERLTAIADQVRRISGVTDELTPEQMETNLLNVTVKADLPSAENSAFGVATGDAENGIMSHGTVSTSTRSFYGTTGWTFTASEAFSILGFRSLQAYSEKQVINLWDSSQNVVASITVNGSTTEWTNHYLDSPVQVSIGETYTVTMCKNYLSYTPGSGTTFNSKLTDIQLVYAEGDKFPTGTERNVALVDIIIAPVQAELPDSYEIQRTTMDDIAVEVQRISGATTKLNTTQIIDALEDIEFGSISEEEAHAMVAAVLGGIENGAY